VMTGVGTAASASAAALYLPVLRFEAYPLAFTSMPPVGS
jgi:hypothetical protein